MNNLSQLKQLNEISPGGSSAHHNSSWRRRLYDLPISRKTSLIPWFSFGGLILLVGAGGLILHSTLKNQLREQAASQLEVKSEIVNSLLLTESENRELQLEKTLQALTARDTYSGIYWLGADGNFSRSLTLLRQQNEPAEQVNLVNQGILDQAIASPGQIIEQFQTLKQSKYALAATTVRDSQGRAQGVLVHGTTVNSLNSSLRNSLLAQTAVAVIILIFIIYLSKILASAITQPIQTLQKVAEKFSTGDLKARAQISTQDEVGLLSSTFNILADSIEMNEARLRQDAEQSRLLQGIANDISQANDELEVLQVAVNSSQSILKADRVIYLHFEDDWQGTVVAEAVSEQYPRALGSTINDPCFAERFAEEFRNGKVTAIANIYQAELNDCHLKMLEPFAVVASLVTPVVYAEKLAGLLIAHQCSESRAWQEDEIALMKQISEQVGRVTERIELLAQQRRAQQQEKAARETLQRRALELLMEVDPVSQGDLTVQVKVQEDEIGTIGDSYNATIESLRKLVAQVKTAALQVSQTTSEKDLSLRELSSGASAQTQEINQALEKIRDISNSIDAVANNAKAAETAMEKAAATVSAGDDAMNQTVIGFQEIRDTVAATAKKVKRLGESSQKISKVVNVISSFADQTNLLALNASIEAAHAGEEGRGFAVVAEEVRSLARQSAAATAEIEGLVAEIQAETNEVVAAMEAGTEQVVAGTKLIDKTRYSLIQIADVSQEINQLVEEIAAATVAQSQDSSIVSQTMMDVAAISSKTATEAGEVSDSFQDLLTVAQQLQHSVAKFKVK